MAKLSNYLIILMAFFIATTTIAKEELTAEQCATEFGQKCGEQVYDKLFLPNKTSILTLNCCYKLVQMGYPCHNRLTLSTLATHKVNNWTEILTKSDKLYNKCDKLTNPGNAIYLASCIGNIGYDCGGEVYNSIIRDKGIIDKNCCGKLVKMGEGCNVNIVKALLRSHDIEYDDGEEVIEKSKKIFQQCISKKE
ncbi:hypothetical protein Lal_00028704 [Lupinus albus]|uniref:Putative Prolamin-like domain-containing protein n=1 Tax=Lupinus albus TaxID=3870 RepID=A0A6A4NYE2_LUPAL|nr:putative Prolamin-like domain-containing protein [Lupinus albus]KAF1884817.1 hypothetical protein Lal_00028704 [Lupinus albus]